MITLYSHQLVNVRANLISTIGDHETIMDIIKHVQDTTTDELGTDNKVFVELLNNLGAAFISDENDFDYITHNYMAAIYSGLFMLSAQYIYREIISSFLDHVVLSNIKNKSLKVNNPLLLSVIDNAIIVAGTSSKEEDDTFWEAFDNIRDVAHDHCLKDNEELGISEVTDEDAWEHYRIINVAFIKLIKAAVTPAKKNEDEIIYNGRAGLAKALVKQLDSLYETMLYCGKMRESVIGVGGLITERVPAVVILEEGDIQTEGVVLLDDKTPLVETYCQDLMDEHYSYMLDFGTERVSWLMSNGIPIPRLNDFIRNEITTLQLHEMVY